MKTIRNIILPVLLPVILAIILPQVIFGLRDRYLMGNSFADKRQGIDPSYLNVEFVGGTFTNKLAWIAGQDKSGKDLHLIEVEDDLDEKGREAVLSEIWNSYLMTGTMDYVTRLMAFYYRYNRVAYEEITKTLKSPEDKKMILSIADTAEGIAKDIKVHGGGQWDDYDFEEIMGTPQIYETKWSKYILLNEQDRTALEIRRVLVTIYENPEFVMEFYVDADSNGIYSVSISSKDVAKWKGSDNWNLNLDNASQVLSFYSLSVSIIEYTIAHYYSMGDYTELASEPDTLSYIWEFGTDEDMHMLHFEADCGLEQPGELIYKMGVKELEDFLSD